VILDHADNESELAKASVEFQLDTWKKELDRVRSADATLGTPLGIDLGKLKFDGELGENVQLDVEIIAKAAQAAKVQVKDIWAWEKLPYVLRCAGISGTNDQGGRAQKKSRKENAEGLVIDAD
jgi:hypothetical protein